MYPYSKFSITHVTKFEKSVFLFLQLCLFQIEFMEEVVDRNGRPWEGVGPNASPWEVRYDSLSHGTTGEEFIEGVGTSWRVESHEPLVRITDDDGSGVSRMENWDVVDSWDIGVSWDKAGIEIHDFLGSARETIRPGPSGDMGTVPMKDKMDFMGTTGPGPSGDIRAVPMKDKMDFMTEENRRGL